jgi:hypothetical protein
MGIDMNGSYKMAFLVYMKETEIKRLVDIAETRNMKSDKTKFQSKPLTPTPRIREKTILVGTATNPKIEAGTVKQTMDKILLVGELTKYFKVALPL